MDIGGRDAQNIRDPILDCCNILGRVLCSCEDAAVDTLNDEGDVDIGD